MPQQLIFDIAREQAFSLPGAELSYPFGEETEVFKVRNKVFLLLGALSGSDLVTIKVRPSDSEALRTAYSEIQPGYHMNKKHWLSVSPGNVPDQILTDLVTESYLLVVESLPLKEQPVNPASYGKPT